MRTTRTTRRARKTTDAVRGEATLERNAPPWLPEHRTPALSPILYSEAVVRAAQPDVQSAPTRSEMITRSGIPAELWSGPGGGSVRPARGRVEAPTYVPESEATELAQRVLTVRRAGCSRGRLGELAGLGTGGKIWRIERNKILPDEVAQLEAALRLVELELGIAVVNEGSK